MWRRRSEPRAGRDGWGNAAVATLLMAAMAAAPLCAAASTTRGAASAAASARAPRVLTRRARSWECALNDDPCGDCTNTASSPCYVACRARVCLARGCAWRWWRTLAGARNCCVCGRPCARAVCAV